MSATVVARALDMKVIEPTGIKGGDLAQVAVVAVKILETETYMIQELYLPMYNCWCLMLEDSFLENKSRCETVDKKVFVIGVE